MMRDETYQTKLYQFHKAFQHPINDPYPSRDSETSFDKLRNFRKKLITEEYEEVIDAIDNKHPEDVLKELCDLVYVCIGFATTYGWPFDVAFNRVHISNMSKLDENGKPIFREDGKVLKSKKYKEPQMEGLVDEQLPDWMDWV